MSYWKTIPRYPRYEANRDGYIRRKQHAHDSTKPGSILSTHKGKKDYVRVCVEDHTQAIAPLICETFHGKKPTTKHQAAHRNGNKSDNSARNLSWLTQSENYKDSIRHGTHRKGERSGAAKVSNKDVIRIRKLADRLPQCVIAKKYGISESAISRIILRQTWNHL